MRDEWEKPLREQGCIRMVEGVPGIEIQQKYNNRNTETQKYNSRNTEIQKYNSSGRAGLHTDGGRCADNRNTCTYVFLLSSAGKRNTNGNTICVHISIYSVQDVFISSVFPSAIFNRIW